MGSLIVAPVFVSLYEPCLVASVGCLHSSGSYNTSSLTSRGFLKFHLISGCALHCSHQLPEEFSLMMIILDSRLLVYQNIVGIVSLTTIFFGSNG